MKRQLNFDFENEKYVLKENGDIIFSINGRDLRFISLDFYNGVYKDKSAAIELTNTISNDDFKKGTYLFSWLTDIITSIQTDLNDPKIEDVVDDQLTSEPPKLVYLFELSACAGSGFYSDGPSRADKEIASPYPDADYAVKISGKSMEPTISDQSIVFVKAISELQDGDIGIFVVDGDVMCKRFRKEKDKRWLQPENGTGGFKSVILQEGISCIIQGKVLLS